MTIYTALVGAGYWGKNLLRTLNNLGSLKAVFDSNIGMITTLKNDPAHSNIEFGADYTQCLDRWDIQGIVIATPPNTHFDIAVAALNKGKHVFIEKPMTVTVEEAEELVTLAKSKNLKLMVGHTFLYTPEIEYIKKVINSGAIGDIKYIHASRLNLGKFQKSNVIIDLAPHDIAIFNYLLNDTVKEVQTNGYSFINEDVTEVAFLNFKYYSNIICNLHLSWLDPRKVRTTTIVGTKQMIVYDMMSEEKIKIYDKGIDEFAVNSFGEYLIGYRHGDIVSPKTGAWEPLNKELRHFLDCIEKDATPLTDGENGLEVMKVLEAAIKSVKTNKWEQV